MYHSHLQSHQPSLSPRGPWCEGKMALNMQFRVRTLFQKQISRTFPGLFQDSDWFFQDSKIHVNPFTPIISMLILLTVCHTFNVFSLDFNRFPGLSSPGKCHNKIPGLSRFSRTRTNPDAWLDWLDSWTKIFIKTSLKILSRKPQPCYKVWKRHSIPYFAPPHPCAMLTKHFHLTKGSIWPFSSIERGNGGSVLRLWFHIFAHLSNTSSSWL